MFRYSSTRNQAFTIERYLNESIKLGLVSGKQAIKLNDTYYTINSSQKTNNSLKYRFDNNAELHFQKENNKIMFHVRNCPGQEDISGFVNPIIVKTFKPILVDSDDIDLLPNFFQN